MSAEEASSHTSKCYKCLGKGFKTSKIKNPERARAPSRENRPPKHILVESTCKTCSGNGIIVSLKKQKLSEADPYITTIKNPVSEDYIRNLPGPDPLRLHEAAPEKGEALCFLISKWRIYQPIVGHRFSTDDVLTAYLAGQQLVSLYGRHKDDHFTCLDLGTGLGSVLNMMCWQFPNIEYTGIEAQPASFNRAKRTCYINGIEKRAKIVQGDIRDYKFTEKYDVVTGTPPYFSVKGLDIQDNMPGEATGLKTSYMQNAASYPALTTMEDQRPCNFEYRGGIESYCEAASRALKEDGLFFVCISDVTNFQARTLKAASNLPEGQRLTVLKKVEVIPREGLPSLFAVYTMKRDLKSDPVSTLTNFQTERFVIRSQTGNRTLEYLCLLESFGMANHKK